MEDKELFIKITVDKQKKFCDIDYAGYYIELLLLIIELIEDISQKNDVEMNESLDIIKKLLDKGK